MSALRRLASVLRRFQRPRAPRPIAGGAGLPARRHPESLTAELPEAAEEALAALAAELWPEDEYAEIVRCYRPGGDQS